MPSVRVVGREGGSEDSGLPHSHVTSSPADDRDKAGRIPMPRTSPGTPGMPFQPELGRAANSLAPGGEGPRAPRGEPLQPGGRLRAGVAAAGGAGTPTMTHTSPRCPAGRTDDSGQMWGSGRGPAARPASGPSPMGHVPRALAAPPRCRAQNPPQPARLPLAGQGGLHR